MKTTKQVHYNKRKRNQLILGFLVVIVIIVGCNKVEKKTTMNSQLKLDNQLNMLANEVNKKIPMMVDKEMRLDNTVAISGNIFQYNYTLINMDKQQVDTTVFKNQLIPFFINDLKTNPGEKYIRDNKITVKHYYRDKNGEYIVQFFITPEQYEK